jgi:putative flavoprotein involved in K+ transport
VAVERHDTVIVGAGQAGLAMSYHLSAAGREHILLERAQVAQRWHAARWDSLRLQFPNESLCLPGYPYPHGDNDGFIPRDAIASYVDDYARAIAAPVRCGVEVTALCADPKTDRLELQTGTQVVVADNVVIATGPFQRPSLPPASVSLPEGIQQLHSSEYRNPAQLWPGAVLVVGSGGSGGQITDELVRAGRTVYLSVGRHRRIPRRYRGRDAYSWLMAMGVFDREIDDIPGRRLPPGFLFSGVDGGHTIDLRDFSEAGVVLLGRLHAVTDGRCFFALDLEERLAFGDVAAVNFMRSVDEFVTANGLIAPDDLAPKPRATISTLRPPTHVDIRRAGIASVIWCTGYDYDLDWLRVPVRDEQGIPQQKRGVTSCSGVYFLGLYWMHKFKSGTFFGVGEDAAYLAERIAQF